MLPPEDSSADRQRHITVKQLVDEEINRRVYRLQINMFVCLSLITKALQTQK